MVRRHRRRHRDQHDDGGGGGGSGVGGGGGGDEYDGWNIYGIQFSNDKWWSKETILQERTQCYHGY
ncbi:hypothetical protein OsI_18282 [Oryza sativa Indica Group]|uniref:Uncharacterized protein n=1 Tax=Oryza sativa subsp. indica TaxID=39946 RepID=B8AXK0_ORYSI|nr:hypothetical protein OsI_18282 [Oryza sativa Indica Group]